MDTVFSNVSTGIKANFMKETILNTSIITLDNIHTIDTGVMVAFTDGQATDLPEGDIEFVIIGDIEANGGSQGLYS